MLITESAWLVADTSSQSWGIPEQLDAHKFQTKREVFGVEGRLTASPGISPPQTSVAEWNPLVRGDSATMSDDAPSISILPGDLHLGTSGVEFPTEEPQTMWVREQHGVDTAAFGDDDSFGLQIYEFRFATPDALERVRGVLAGGPAPTAPHSSTPTAPPLPSAMATPAAETASAQTTALQPGQVRGPDGKVRSSRPLQVIHAEWEKVYPGGREALSALPQMVVAGDREDLKRQLNNALSDKLHVVHYNVAANSAVKYVLRYRCSCHTDPTIHGKGTKCQWWVAYEQTEHGWALSRGSAVACGVATADQEDHKFPLDATGYGLHNHPLYESSAASLANAAGHEITGKYLALGNVLAKTGMTPASIHGAISQQWRDDHGDQVPPPWVYKTVQNRFVPSGRALDFDFSGLLTSLEARRESSGLRYFLDHDPMTNRISRILVEQDGAAMEWARGGAHNVLLFDPTHGTNRYRWQLCLLTTVSTSGKTVILAWCVLQHAGVNDFEWAFLCFASCVHVPPAIVFTDRDANLETALNRMRDGPWPEMHHHLCIFHLSKNFYEHLRKHFRNDGGQARWREVYSLFWTITKTTDVSFREQFDGAWAGFCRRVEETATDSEDLQQSLEWLRGLAALKERFVYCYTWSRCTLMLNSTSRIERMQRTAKETLGMNGGTTLCQMNERIPVYNDDARRRIEIHDFKIAGRQLRAAAHLPAFIRPLQSRVSSYAFAHITSQAQEAANYCFEAPSTRSGTSYLVVRRAGTVVKAKGPTLDADGAVKSHECVHDEGLDPDPIAGRLVTAHFDGAGTSKTLVKASCTCQFGISSGMGLCRHVLCVATIEQTQSIKIENFCIPKWLHHDEAGKAAMHAKLMRTPRWEPTRESDRAELPGGGQASDPKPLDRRARRALLAPLMQQCLEMGIENDAQLKVAVDEMSVLAERLSDAATVSAASRKRPASRGPTSSGARSAVGRDDAEARDEGDDTPGCVMMRHLSVPTRKEILLAMGNRWQFAPWEPFRAGSSEVLGWAGLLRGEMVGRSILYRWVAGPGASTSNRWFVGKIVDALLDSTDVEEGMGLGRRAKNFKVDYGDVCLGQSLERDRCLNYTLKQSPGATWWVLLEEKPLHGAPQGGVRPPERRFPKGRPQTARHAPPAGPTSKKQRRHKTK